MGYAALRVLLFGRRSSPWLLAEDLPTLEPLYGQYRVPRYHFFSLPLLAIFLRAVLIAAAKNHGTVQIILVVCIELFLLASYITLKPGKTRPADILGVFLAIVRLITSGLLVAFIEPVALAPIPRVVIGIVALVLFSIAVVVMFFNTLWNLGLQRLWLHRRFAILPSRSSTSTSQGSFENEKATEKDVEKAESTVTSRPSNPTPTHSGPRVDPVMNAPDVLSQVTPTTAEPSSAHSTDTTVSYGVEVPSRWQTSVLQSPSRTGSDIARADVASSSLPSPLSHNRQSTIEEARAL